MDKLNQELDILFACDMNPKRPWFRDRIPGIKDAIENTNYSVKLIDIYGLLGTHMYMPTELTERKKFLQSADLLSANKSFENHVIQIQPKVLLLGTADNYIEFLLPKTIRNIRESGIYVAGILGDDEFNYPSYRFLLGWFDLFIAYVKPCVNYYEQFNLSHGYFFPNSCYLDNKNFLDYSQNTEFDVILVGAPIANRPSMMKALIDAGLKVAIFGSKDWEKVAFAREYYHGFIATEEFDEVLSKAKIILAFLEDHLTGKLHMNTKIWEAVRVGRMPVSTHYDPLESDYGLTEGIDIVTYKNTKELVEKVCFYSKNDEARLKIAERLHSKVRNNFDYSVMYRRLFEHLVIDTYSNERKFLVVDDLIEAIDNDPSIQYFKSKLVQLDIEIINALKIIKEDSNSTQDYVYFDSIEGGKRVINRWPFINFSNIIFLGPARSKLYYRYIFYKSFFLSRTFHIKQFYATSEVETLNGWLNRIIDKLAYTKFAKIIKSHIGKYLNK